MPNVVSVGIGLNKSEQQVIVIGLESMNADPDTQWPSVIEGYPVEVREVGSIKKQ